MDVSNLISHEPAPPLHALSIPNNTQPVPQRAHQYPTRRSMTTHTESLNNQQNVPYPDNQGFNGNPQHGSDPHDPSRATVPLPKNVAFQLLFDEPSNRARLPMRVQIFPHDTTDSIIATVKNFYGLYDGAATGVSFEDDQGHILIARYENLRNNMVVYVRVVHDYSQPGYSHGPAGWNSASPISASRVPYLGEAFHMPPPAQLSQYNSPEQPNSRPASVPQKRSMSPRQSRNRRSASAQKNLPRSGIKSRDNSLPRTVEDPYNDALNNFSDSDGGAASVSSSRRARMESLATAEISVDNIVEGNRRKRAKFESSVSL